VTRWLVVVLLAANLGFMAWMYQRLTQEISVTPAPEPRGSASLRLLSEIEELAPVSSETETVAEGGVDADPGELAAAAPSASESPAAGDEAAGTRATDDSAPALVPDATTAAVAIVTSESTPTAGVSADVAVHPGDGDVNPAPPPTAALDPPESSAVQAEVEDPTAAAPAHEAPPDGGGQGQQAPAPRDTAVLAPPPAQDPTPPSGADPADRAPTAQGQGEEALPTRDVCLVLGPLAEEPSVGRLVAWAEARGGTASTRKEILGRKDAHWMYLGPFADLTAARRESDRLQALGVSDHLAVRHEELGPVVSLGLYSSAEGLERRVAALRAVGIEPNVVPRGPRTTRWWVDARLPADDRVTAAAFAAAGDTTGAEPASVQVTDCP